MPKPGQAYRNVETGEVEETVAFRGDVAFMYGGGGHLFHVSRVDIVFGYTDAAFTRWQLSFPVEGRSLAGLMPYLLTLGLSEAEVVNLPAHQTITVTVFAKPDVLAALTPEFQRAKTLAAIFHAGQDALLDLDNYENPRFEID